MFFLVLMIVGCGKATPPGLPPLAPCKVKVHDNGRPLTKIDIFFQRVEGQAGWSLNGRTGADGVAIAQTISGSFSAKGIPIGTYRITLKEQIELPPELGNASHNVKDPTMFDPTIPEQQRKNIADQRQKYLTEHRMLPAILCDPAQTPLELVVSTSGAELDVDVSQFQ
jgi:hypothetical protein